MCSMETNLLPQRMRRRAGQRGAVFVEALIVIPTLTLLFAGMLYVRVLYLAKMQVMESVRGRTWQYTQMQNCGHAGNGPSAGYDPLSATPFTGGASGGVSGNDGSSPIAATGANLDGSGIATAGLNNTSVGGALGAALNQGSFSGSATMSGVAPYFPSAVTAGYQMTLTCNEIPQDGTILNIPELALQGIKDLFSTLIGGW
jgi:hypothetical protein